MAPTSRRRKKFEEKQRKVQGRNFVAAIFFLLVIGGTYFLILHLIRSPVPTIHVSIARINHVGTRAIPFSEESCNKVRDAFQQHLKRCNAGSIHEVGEQDSDLKLMSSEINRNDILIVYLNGHLTDANCIPSKWSTKPASDANDTAEEDVYFIGPESNLGEQKLSRLLLDIKNSPAKTKLVLLDAGRFSWSPVFPGRAPNEFQTRLAAKLKSDAWGLEDDFWIITSHSDAEISNVSTPLEGSLFSIAIQESLKSLAKPNSGPLPIQKLYEEIRNRTASYSVNFEDKTLQNPVLMKAGVGVVQTTSPEQDSIVVTWQSSDSKASDNEEAKPAAEYEWETFARNPEEFSKWLLDDPHVSALPKHALQKAELFLDQGDEKKEWSTSEKQLLQQYIDSKQNFEKRPSTPTFFSNETLQAKHNQFSQFRNALLEMAIWSRFRNHMRFWNDDTYDKDIPPISEVEQPILLRDDQLTKSQSLPVVESLSSAMQTFAANNNELIESVQQRRKRTGALTPMQAEMLGIASQRYLPLLKQFRAKPSSTSETEPVPNRSAEDDVKTFALDLEPKRGLPRYNPENKDGTGQPPGTGFRFVVDLARKEVSPWAILEPTTDTSNRYVLAAIGSEFSNKESGIVPNIEWNPVDRQISMAPLSGASVLKVPFYQQKEFKFQLSTSVVASVDLAIKMIETEKPEGLKFGFNEDYDKEYPITQLDGSNYQFGKPFSVHFRYPDPKQELIGKRFKFQISAQDRKSRSDPYAPFEFFVEITKDAQFKIASNRVFARSAGRPVRLYRWGIPPERDQWEPVQMRTLANVKSAFEFEVNYDFDSTKYFTAKIFKIEDREETDDNAKLSSDRDDAEKVRNFVRALDKQSNTAGTRPLDRRESFEQLAQAEFELPKSKRTAKIEFIRPPKKPGEPVDQEPTKTVDVKNGLMVVFYETDKPDPNAEVKTDPTENRNPDWYQFVLFDPQEPAISKIDRLKIKPWLADRLKTDINQLEDHLAPVVDPKQAARLTIVSKKSFDEKTNYMEPIGLTEALEGDGGELSRGDDHALLILDLLGIPNYLTLDTDGKSLKDSGYRKSFTGIRFSQKPSNWEVYPQTWSFASDQLPEPPFEWLAGRSSEFQNIYVRIGPPEEGKGEGQGIVELFLPMEGAFLNLGNDFTLIWKGSTKQLANAQSRQHQFAIGATGVTAWSELTSHTVGISRILKRSDNELIIRRKDESEPLGQWRFITESPGYGPKLSANRVEFENNPLQMARATITLDVRHIIPPIDSDAIKLSLDGKEVPKDALKRFLDSRPIKIENGLYRFSFAKLREMAEVETPPKENTIVKARITDFFGEVIPHELPLRIKEPKKPIPKPKPTFVEVALVHGDQPVQLLRFTNIQLSQGGVVLNTETGSIKVSKNKNPPSLRLDRVLPGNYSLQVDALIRREGDAIYTAATAQQTKIVVPKDGAKVTLTFK